MLRELQATLSACPHETTLDEYRSAIIDANVTGKHTTPARQRTFRYLRELYALDSSVDTFRVLRTMWDLDIRGRPLLAILSAVHRDAALRGTAPAIIRARPGDPVSADDLAERVQLTYPGNYNGAVAAKIGRNALSSWTQSGHLSAIRKNRKVRATAHSTAGSAVYALYLGHVNGLAGQALLDTLYVQMLDSPLVETRELAFKASALGWLEYREAGGLVDVSFRSLAQGAA
jgi:hypothetical protein